MNTAAFLNIFRIQHEISTHTPLFVLEMLCIYALFLLISYVIFSMMKQNRFLIRKNRQRESLYSAVSALLTAESLDELYPLLIRYINEQISAPVIYFKENPLDRQILTNEPLSRSKEFLHLFLTQQSMDYAVKTYEENVCNVFRPISFDGMICYLPVFSHKKVWGVAAVFVDNHRKEDTPEDLIEIFRFYLSNFALAVERDYVVASHTKLQIKAEKDKIQSNMLRTISHDLRTPLTAIIGATNTLLEQYKNLTEADVNEFLTYILDDSNWLLNMVENLLSVARIQVNQLPSSLSEEVIDDLISEAVSKFHQRHKNVNLKISLSEQIIIINADPVLLEQVFLNLLENALYYSPDSLPIEIKVLLHSDVAFVTFRDYGEKVHANLEQFFRESDGSIVKEIKGIGINLAISKTILKAHRGFMTNPPQEVGSLMVIALPIACLSEEAGTLNNESNN